MKSLASLLLLLAFAVPAVADHPYDSACLVTVNLGVARGNNGGSGTLIAENGKQGLVLTVKHVAERKGLKAACRWGDVTVKGSVLDVHPTADVALLLVELPKGVRPVPVALPTKDTGPFVLAGYPGYDRNTLRFQVGDFKSIDSDTLTVTCRPEPGMSGGPAYDRYGRVVGTVSAYSRIDGLCGSGTAMMELINKYVQPAPARSSIFSWW